MTYAVSIQQSSPEGTSLHVERRESVAVEASALFVRFDEQGSMTFLHNYTFLSAPNA